MRSAASRPQTALSPRKAPRQGRSLATVEVILEAAARVLARHSLAGFNTNRVAEVAGVSVGSLYQYFPNKAALTAALIERSQSALLAQVRAVVDQPASSLHAHVAQLVQVGIANQFGQSTLAAALDHEESRLMAVPEMAAVLRAAQSRLVDAVLALLRKHDSEATAPLTAQTASDLMLIAKSLIEADAALQSTPSADLAARVERALLGYLCA